MEGALKTTPATASYGLEAGALVFPSSRFKFKRMHALAIAFDEPGRQERPVLVLPLPGQTEEISRHFAATSSGAAAAGPGRAVRDIDVVVHGNLFAGPNVPPRHDVRRIVLEQLIRIRIATVIDVTVRDAQQHDLAIGIRTVVHAFAEVRSNWRFSGDFTQHVHAPNPIAGSKETPREHANALNGRWPDFDLSCR